MTATDTHFRSGCPIASALDLVGDRWTMVIIRDLANGKTRFGQFLDSPERIATNILRARLISMEAHGLIEARVYQARPRRLEYRLTRKGADLIPVLQAFCRWAAAHLPGRWTPPAAFMALRAEDPVTDEKSQGC